MSSFEKQKLNTCFPDCITCGHKVILRNFSHHFPLIPNEKHNIPIVKLVFKTENIEKNCKSFDLST